jgi:hypothetical protein
VQLVEIDFIRAPEWDDHGVMINRGLADEHIWECIVTGGKGRRQSGHGVVSR